MEVVNPPGPETNGPYTQRIIDFIHARCPGHSYGEIVLRPDEHPFPFEEFVPEVTEGQKASLRATQKSWIAWEDRQLASSLLVLEALVKPPQELAAELPQDPSAHTESLGVNLLPVHPFSKNYSRPFIPATMGHLLARPGPPLFDVPLSMNVVFPADGPPLFFFTYNPLQFTRSTQEVADSIAQFFGVDTSLKRFVTIEEEMDEARARQVIEFLDEHFRPPRPPQKLAKK